VNFGEEGTKVLNHDSARCDFLVSLKNENWLVVGGPIKPYFGTENYKNNHVKDKNGRRGTVTALDDYGYEVEREMSGYVEYVFYDDTQNPKQWRVDNYTRG